MLSDVKIMTVSSSPGLYLNQISVQVSTIYMPVAPFISYSV